MGAWDDSDEAANKKDEARVAARAHAGSPHDEDEAR